MRRSLGTVACAAALVAIAGCANSGTMTPATRVSSEASSRTRPASSSGYTFYTVDYPYESPNRVTGIADNQEIVGVYGDGGSQNQYHSYTSQYSASQPYTQFQNDDYPNGTSTYMASITQLSHSKGIIQSGYTVNPSDLNGTWGLINDKGLWTLVRRHRGEGKCHMMQLFGINDSYYAVGFYWQDNSPPSGGCAKHSQYITEVRPGEGFHDFSQVVGKNPVASGVTNSGWLVGSTDNSGGASQGWTKMVCKGCRKGTQVEYWNYNNDTSFSTQLLGVSDAGVAVGTYQDASGNWHGLIASNLLSTAQQPGWQSIDEPNGNQTNTVISGIDDSGDICGWYTGTDGQTHGFVGIYQ